MNSTETHNLLIFSKLRMGGGKIDLRIRSLVLFLLLFFFFVVYRGFQAGQRAVLSSLDEVQPVIEQLHPRYFSNDSLLVYAERAYMHDDPEALYIMAAAATAKQAGLLPDSIYTVSIPEAQCMIYRAAQLGHPRAVQALNHMIATGKWNYPLEDK